MKKIVAINVVCNGSTGKIMCDTLIKAQEEGYDTYCFFGRGKKNPKLNAKRISSKISVFFHVFLARIGFNGHGSYFATKKLIHELKQINPDIIHLHNIHGYYLNFKVLFKYLENYQGKIIWMLHDCWTFTGHCSYFSSINCQKWQKQCFNCSQLNAYPKEYIDTTEKEYKLKKRLFTKLKNVIIVTPSYWLEEIVKKSFLNKYRIKTIHNGINLEIFKPIKDNKILDKYNIPKNKKIILGVANIWEERKGFVIFLKMAKLLNDNEVIVLVGVNDKQIKLLPNNIIGIKRTDNQDDLAKIYSISDIFVNPSREETFSLVTVEAMACGLPVVVCGISAPKELVTDAVGIVLNKYAAKDYYNAYKEILKKKLDKNDIVEYAQNFSNQKMINENLKLYKEK